MKPILVLGAGKIGSLVAGLLAESGSYRVQLADAAADTAADVASAHKLETIDPFVLDATDEEALRAHVTEHEPVAVVSSMPYYCNVPVAQAARDRERHLIALRALGPSCSCRV